MAVGYLPKTVTKDKLFRRAKERFVDWLGMSMNDNISVEQMYEDMSASCYCGDPESDFPDECRDETICYDYDAAGNCSFMIDDIEVEVLDLRSMRKYEYRELYADACVLSVTYKDEPGGGLLYHIIPDALLYGSTTKDFDEGHVVDPIFIAAAKAYIKQHNITPDMQKED